MIADEAMFRVGCFFSRLKCPKHYVGYNYLKCALVSMVRSDCLIGFISKTVYVNVAQQFCTDTSNVERCLRTFVDKWWSCCRCDGYFESKPTNKQLLTWINDELCHDLLNDIVKRQKRRERRQELLNSSEAKKRIC